ncbi:hypothetical protein [Actinomadura flavalba]|uniref:hypothetical protein n=1 Tax=Actinomadura flavalba TaxID=1120938 RepID=UPI00036D30B7|nr:hypothetical protein [Actinomadura flavalba]
MRLRKLAAGTVVAGSALALIAANAPAASASEYFEIIRSHGSVVGQKSLTQVTGSVLDNGNDSQATLFTITWTGTVSGQQVVDVDVVRVENGQWKNFSESPDFNGAPFTATSQVFTLGTSV